MGIIYCYNDKFSWGQEVAAEIQKRKGSSQMMTHAVQVEDEIGTGAFIHVSEQEGQYTKELAAEIGKKSNVLMVPSAREIYLHDDLLRQYEEFGQWMPSMWVFRALAQVKLAVNDLQYPLISLPRKAGGKNRWIIHDPEQAFRDACSIFGDDGIQLPDGTRQQGYMILQPTARHIGVRWHVFILGQRYAAITESSTGIDPTVPGTACKPINVLDTRYEELLDFCRGFTKDCDLDWACVEIVPFQTDQPGIIVPYVMGYAVSWPFAWFERGGMIFESDCGLTWQSTGIPSVKIWNVFAEWFLERLPK